MNKDKALMTGPMGGHGGLNRLNDMFYDLLTQFDRVWDMPTNTLVFEELQPKKAKFPKLDVMETPSAYIVEAAIAGFDKNAIEIELKDNVFLIKADTKSSDDTKNEEEEVTYLKQEISKRAFRRVVRFPAKIDTNEVECSYTDGIVRCTIGKLKKEVDDTPVKVTIN